jgi:hypothetical protein
VDTRVGLDDVARRKILLLSGIELRPLGRPIRSQSLYRLRYPGSWAEKCKGSKINGAIYVTVDGTHVQVITLVDFHVSER